LNPATLQAQTQHPLTQYTTENGLSLNSVNDLLFDKQGFLWVTTADGLQRFDGYRFQTFKHNPADKKTLPENLITEVYEDANSNLWVTYRTGICFKPKGKNEFTDISGSIQKYVSRFPKTCVYEDDSVVWVAGYPSGIYAVSKQSLSVKKVYSFPPAPDNEIVYSLSRLRKKGDAVWLRKGKDKAGDIYNITSVGLQHHKNINGIKVFYLLPVNNDSVVIITDKFYYKAAASNPFKPVKVIGTIPFTSEFDFEHLNLARKIAGNQYLLQGIERLFVFDGNTETISEYPYSSYFPKELVRYLNTTAADLQQNSWIGFNGIGGIKVSSVRKFNLFNRPFANALPYTLTGDASGNIYSGIYLGDIEQYDKNGNYIKTLALPAAHKRTGSPRAMAMIDSFTLIVRSTLNELYALDTRTGKLQLLTHHLPIRTDSVTRDFETDMHSVAPNEVWFTYSNTILTLKKNNGNYTCTAASIQPAKEVISCFLKTGDKEMWIGSPSGVWHVNNNNFTKIQLPVTYVKQINIQPDGAVWLATTNGIVILRDEKLINTINTSEGLPNSFVYSILFDKNGNGWASTNRGIAKITQQKKDENYFYTVTSYSAKEGLQGDEFNTRGYYKSSGGSLYFAGVNGINFFNPDELINKSEPSPTKLTRIEVNNIPWHPELQPEFISTLNLPYRQNNISLSFSCMDFTVPEKNQYKFWLKGFQNDWSLPQTNNTVQYILPVGEYELYVLGSNYEGVWATEPLIFKINILPPWYQTNWARAIFAFLILSIVAVVFYFISRNRYQKKLRKLQLEQEMQKEKQRLSRDLHDNLGSQLTWLSNNISQLQRAEMEHLPVEQRMNQLKEGAGELMQTLRETIWIINKEKISAVEFFDKLVSHAARHIEAYPPMQLQTEENISVNHQLNSGTALQLFRICQEAITNACKHAEATTLTLKAMTDERHFAINISDNGKGFDAANKEISGHYGLMNMEERARESNLKLEIKSSASEGTEITVSLNV
jgi:signal transduction histidine kinase/ligand-binding sensor domain-containing protein